MNQIADQFTKQEVRQVLLNARHQLSWEERESGSLSICRTVLDILSRAGVSRVAAYLATHREVDVDPLIDWLLARGIKVFVPHCYDETPTFSQLNKLPDATKNEHGLRQAPGRKTFDTNEFDAMIVPGVGFDQKGNRLGRGGGWYDRVLNSELFSIGVCYDVQLLPEISVEEHDKTVSTVVTPTRTITLREEQ